MEAQHYPTGAASRRFLNVCSLQCPFLLQQGCQRVSRTIEPGPDGRFGCLKYQGYLYGREFLHRRKQQHFAFSCRQSVDQAKNPRMTLGGDHHLFRAQIARRQNPRQVFKIVRLGPCFGAPLTVQDKIPCDANQPDAIVAHLSQLIAVAQNAQEGLLHHILRIGCIAGNRIGHAVKRGRILFYQRGHLGVRILLWFGHCLGLQPSDELSFNGSHSDGYCRVLNGETVAYRDASYALSARRRSTRPIALSSRFLADRMCGWHLSSFVMLAPSRLMRARPAIPGSLLALCWLIPAVCAGAQLQSSARTATVGFAGRQDADLTGTYQGHSPAADAAKRVFTLDLASDGTAVFDTLYIGKDRVTQHGRWMQNGSQIVLTF